MTRPITIYRKTKGLNTLVDPVELDHSNGIQELAVAADIEISDRGRISRRKGFGLGLAGGFHSLFCDGGDAICVQRDGHLCIIDSIDMSTSPPTISATPIHTVDANARLRACQVNDRIYWLNGHEKGYIADRQNHEWVRGDYVGPDSDRVVVDPPVGTIVEYYNGRMYVAQGQALWISEPFNYHAFDLARGIIPFASNICMVRAVDDGIFVSTETGVVFLSGLNPNEFQQIPVADHPAIERTDAKFQGNLIFYQNGIVTISKSGQKAAMWLSEEGICAGFTGGRFANLTEEKLEGLPSGLSGSGLVHKGKYLGLIDP